MPGFWRKCRIAFRCVRITAWLIVLTVIGLFLWCNRVGLPDFLKTRLVATLHERGMDLEFSRMRLNLTRGIVAENVRVGQAGTSNTATFTARLVQLELDYSALFQHQRLELDGLVIHDGLFALNLSPTNALTLANLQTGLRFETNNTWSLDHFRAEFAGAQISISGEMAHAPEVLAWKMFAGHQADRGSVIPSLNMFADTLKQVHFEGEPRLRLTVAGDARNVHSVLVSLRAAADGVRTPWFDTHGFQAEASLTAPASAPTNLVTAWGFWTNLQPFRLVWSAGLEKLHSEPLSGRSITCAGVWAAPTLTLTRFAGRLEGGGLAAGAALDVSTRTLTFTNDSDFDPRVVAQLLPEKTRRQLTEISWSRPPVLHVAGSVQLPPWTNAMPENWQADIGASVQVRGKLAATNVAAGGVALDYVNTHFNYADLLWELPDLAVAQGRTQLRLSGQESEATKNFHFLLTGQVDAKIAHPFLKTTNAVHGFDLVTLNDPLHLALDVSGNLRMLTNLTATGRVALTNFAVRGQPFDSIAASLAYSNRLLKFYSPEILRADGAQRMTAELVLLDFNTLTIWITNGWSTADPLPVTRAIGPKTGEAAEPYQFSTPPLVRVNGTVPLYEVDINHPPDNADLTLDVMRGPPFQWGKLHATNVTGTVHWLKQSLLITNIQAALYDGTGHGSVELDFRPRDHDFDYNFSFAVTNVDLHLLAADVSTETNLEGQLAGQVTVTNAISDDWHSWNGDGHVHLRDGLLWDVPIFAFMSPVLNAVSPGLGNSRAKEATAKFVITNGVIATDSLLINSTMMRLQYSGTVDLKQNVNARVTAQLMHNLPVIGPVISLALSPVSKVFECHVTGQLGEPVVKPVYIPNILLKPLLIPLHPLRSLEQLFLPSSSTNAPAAD